NSHAAPEMSGLKIGTGLRGNIAKTPVAQVAQENRSLSLVAAPRMVDDVAVGNDQVQPTVVVDVEEAGPETDVLLAEGRNARRLSAVTKILTTLFDHILVKGVQFALVVRYPDGREAAAVVIVGIHTHAAVGCPAAVPGYSHLHANFVEAELAGSSAGIQ